MPKNIIIIVALVVSCLGCFLLYQTLQPKTIQSEIKSNVVKFDAASKAVIVNKFKSIRGGTIEVRETLTRLDDNTVNSEQSIIEPEYKHFGITGGLSSFGYSAGIAWRPSLDIEVSGQAIIKDSQINGGIIEGRYWIW